MNDVTIEKVESLTIDPSAVALLVSCQQQVGPEARHNIEATIRAAIPQLQIPVLFITGDMRLSVLKESR